MVEADVISTPGIERFLRGIRCLVAGFDVVLDWDDGVVQTCASGVVLRGNSPMKGIVGRFLIAGSKVRGPHVRRAEHGKAGMVPGACACSAV